MKKYTIELDDNLSAIYEGIAKMNHKPAEEVLQIILRKVIETMVKERPVNRAGKYERKRNGSNYF